MTIPPARDPREWRMGRNIFRMALYYGMPFRPFPTARTAARLLATLVAGLIAPPLAAQESAPPGLLPAALEVHLGRIGAVGVSTGMAGVSGTIGIGNGFRVGAGAWSSLGRLDDASALAARSLDLGVGYGGALMEYRPPSLPASLRLLVGGGAATLQTTAVGTPFDTETFLVVEPALTLRRQLFGPLYLGGSVAYRSAYAVDSRFLIEARDLGGFSGSILVGIGR